MALIEFDGTVHAHPRLLADAQGVSPRGHVSTTYVVLLAVFGLPDVDPGRPGNRAAWVLRTPVGTATVYDGDGVHNVIEHPEAIVRWHIAGHSPDVVNWINRAVAAVEQTKGCPQLPVPQSVGGWTVVAALPVPYMRNQWYVLVDRGSEYEQRGRYGTLHVDAVGNERDAVNSNSYIGRKGHYDLPTVEKATADLLDRAGALPEPVTAWWALSITSDEDCPYGEDCCNTTTLYRSEQDARDALVAYVDAHWAENVGADEEQPQDPETRVDEYFDTFCTDEQYRLTHASVA